MASKLIEERKYESLVRKMFLLILPVYRSKEEESVRNLGNRRKSSEQFDAYTD